MRKLALIIAAIWISTAVTAWAASFPGPDDFGHTAVAIPFNLRDISASGTFVLLGDDDRSGAIALPFAFNFYGAPVNQVFIFSNGFIAFSIQNSFADIGRPLPQMDDTNDLIAGFWEHLNSPFPGNIRYETLGASPNREFVVGFYNVGHHFLKPEVVTFEMILHESTNAIELQYGSTPSDGGTHSVGIENAAGTDGLQIAFGDVSFNDQGFLISPNASITKELTSGPVSNAVPDTITFETLNSSCEPGDTFEFFLNGTSLGIVPADPTLGCECLAPIDVFAVTDAALIASAWNIGGNNDFRFVKTAIGPFSSAFAWTRATIGSGPQSEALCILDIGGGDCTVVSLCNPLSFDQQDQTTTLVDPFMSIDIVIEVGQPVVTAYDFTITYAPSDDLTPVIVRDTVPVESEVVAIEGDDSGLPVTPDNPATLSDGENGLVDVSKTESQSATSLEWEPDPTVVASDIRVDVETLVDPGETVEGGCDALKGKGATPGLYGLCVAFCEAQGLDDMAKAMKAGGVPAERILERYRAKRGPEDPDMPCIISPACGTLTLNDGAVAFEIDESGEIVLDPATGEPVVVAGPTDPLRLVVVADLDGDGVVPDGSGDEDGDGLTDADEALNLGTDPCLVDTDSDSVNDGDGVDAQLDQCLLEGLEVTGFVDAVGCPFVP